MQQKLDEIKDFREKMKVVAGEAKDKEELYKQLVGTYQYWIYIYIMSESVWPIYRYWYYSYNLVNKRNM